MLDADVNFQVARDFTERIKEQALGEDVLNAVQPGQQLVKIVYDELVGLLGGEHVGLNPGTGSPYVILVAGLQGAGKTTFVAKLAQHLKGASKSAPFSLLPMFYRPAAVDQLKTLAATMSIPVHSIEEDGVVVRDAVRVAREALAEARRTGRDTVIVDTAGRLHVDDEMMDEVAKHQSCCQA